jgi:hypothetical protein
VKELFSGQITINQATFDSLTVFGLFRQFLGRQVGLESIKAVLIQSGYLIGSGFLIKSTAFD